MEYNFISNRRSNGMFALFDKIFAIGPNLKTYQTQRTKVRKCSAIYNEIFAIGPNLKIYPTWGTKLRELKNMDQIEIGQKLEGEKCNLS